MSVTIVKYFIAQTDIYEEPKHPNIVKFINRSPDEITLILIKKRLEALGAFRYLFKTLLPGIEDYVWEDFIEDLVPVPTYKNEIVLKALRLEDKLGVRKPPAAAVTTVPANPASPITLQKVRRAPEGDPADNKATPSLSATANTASPRGEGIASRIFLSNEETQRLEQLEKDTHFNLKELRSMYAKFKKEAPSLEINKEGFVKVTEGMGIKDKFLQELIFNKFDSDRSGSVDFSEFAKGMSIITRGTPEEKLESAFKMYDVDGKGLISRSGFIRIMQSFMDVHGGTISFMGKTFKDTPSACDEFFSTIDKNGDGVITYEEYKKGALQHPELLQALRFV